MQEKYSSKQFLQIPYDIIAKCKDNPFDAMVWAFIFGWENSKRDDRVKLKSSSIAEFFSVGSATVERSIKRLKDVGLIGTKQTVHGCFYTTRSRTIQKFHVHQNDGDKSIKMMESCPSKRWTHDHQNDGHHSIRSNVDHSFNNSSSYDDELAESSISEKPSFRPDQIQAMRGYGWHERKSLRPMATLSDEDTDLVTKVFGANKLDDIRTILCQDMADAPNFVATCCNVVKSRMERGLDNPVGYFDGVVKGTWKGGNYNDLQKREQQEAEARTKRIKEMFNGSRS